ncbi:hypothetical protein ACIQF8_20540 [Pseudarthrobacter sp. NPDC092184]
MDIPEYAFAFCVLLGTLLVPVFVLYQILRHKRRAVRLTMPSTSRGNR